MHDEKSTWIRCLCLQCNVNIVDANIWNKSFDKPSLPSWTKVNTTGQKSRIGQIFEPVSCFFYYMAIMYLDEEIQFVSKIFCLGIDRWILSVGWLKTVVCQIDKFRVSGKYAHAGASRWELMICLVPKLLITLISHERHGVSNHRQLDSSPSNLFRLTSKETKLRITTLWQECIGCRDWKLVTCRRVCTPVVFFNRPWYGVNYDICTY